MKRHYPILKALLTLALFFVFAMTSSKMVFANNNTTKENATALSIGGTVTGTFNDAETSFNYPSTYYYKITIPNNIGNKWIIFSLSSYANGDDIKLEIQDEIGNDIDSIFVGKNDSDWIRLGMAGSGSNDSVTPLTPGKTYYIVLSDPVMGWGYCQGNYVLSVTSVKDDNWGTFEKAQKITCNKTKKGTLEYSTDIDCYYVKLPKDKKKYTFILSSDNEMYALFANSNGIKIDDTTIYRNSTDNSFTAKGNGQKIYIRLESENEKDNINYSIKVVAEKSTISTLKLTAYKKGSKKIIGKTIKNATVKIVVNKKTYTVKSNKNGKFTVKLKNKLKSKQKIKVTVSKTNYKKKTKTFKVK